MVCADVLCSTGLEPRTPLGAVPAQLPGKRLWRPNSTADTAVFVVGEREAAQQEAAAGSASHQQAELSPEPLPPPCSTPLPTHAGRTVSDVEAPGASTGATRHGGGAKRKADEVAGGGSARSVRREADDAASCSDGGCGHEHGGEPAPPQHVLRPLCVDVAEHVASVGRWHFTNSAFIMDPQDDCVLSGDPGAIWRYSDLARAVLSQFQRPFGAPYFEVRADDIISVFLPHVAPAAIGMPVVDGHAAATATLSLPQDEEVTFFSMQQPLANFQPLTPAHRERLVTQAADPSGGYRLAWRIQRRHGGLEFQDRGGQHLVWLHLAQHWQVRHMLRRGGDGADAYEAWAAWTSLEQARGIQHLQHSGVGGESSGRGIANDPGRYSPPPNEGEGGEGGGGEGGEGA